MVLNTPVLVESQAVKQGKKRDIISYPCCENRVWQDVCEKPAGIERGQRQGLIPNCSSLMFTIIRYVSGVTCLTSPPC